MSALRETILDFRWKKLRVIFNPHQGEYADSTKNKSTGYVLALLQNINVVVFNMGSVV